MKFLPGGQSSMTLYTCATRKTRKKTGVFFWQTASDARDAFRGHILFEKLGCVKIFTCRDRYRVMFINNVTCIKIILV